MKLVFQVLKALTWTAQQHHVAANLQSPDVELSKFRGTAILASRFLSKIEHQSHTHFFSREHKAKPYVVNNCLVKCL